MTSSSRRLARRAPTTAILCAVLILGSATAWAGPAGEGAWWQEHPGPALAAAVGIALLVLATLCGVGCLLAATSAALPRLHAAMDRQAREGGGLLAGSLVLVGVVAAGAALAPAGPGGQGVAAILLLAAGLFALGGALATVPLVGERVLGVRGATASPLRRHLVGALVLGFALLPAAVLRFPPLAFLVGLLAVGWPLGVALRSLLARGPRRAPTPGGGTAEGPAGSPPRGPEGAAV